MGLHPGVARGPPLLQSGAERSRVALGSDGFDGLWLRSFGGVGDLGQVLVETINPKPHTLNAKPLNPLDPTP